MKQKHPAPDEPVVDILRRQIVDGRFSPGDRLPNRTDLIARYHVCSSALQKAQDTLREEGFLHARPRHGTFVTDHPPHLFHVGLVFDQPDLAAHTPDGSPFAVALAQEATAISAKGPWKILPFYAVNSQANSADAQRLNDSVRTKRLAGLILVNPYNIQRVIAAATMPCVTFTGSTDIPGLTCVKLDPRFFIERALDHLQKQKRRRVALIASATLSQPIMSFFHEASSRAGLDSSPRWVHGISLRHPHWARHAVRAIVAGKRDERPDALIVSDDHLVEPTLAGLMDEQMNVGDDVDVIAHCNFQGQPRGPLPVRRLGYVVRDLVQTAVDLIEKRNSGQQVAPVIRVQPCFDFELPVDVESTPSPS